MHSPITTTMHDHMETKNYHQKQFRPYSRTSEVSYSDSQNGSSSNKSPDRMTRASSLNFKKYMQEPDDLAPSIIQIEEVMYEEEPPEQDLPKKKALKKMSTIEDLVATSNMKLEKVNLKALKKLPKHIQQVYEMDE